MRRSTTYRDLAVFTIAQDEPEFIHAWVNHYKNHVANAGDIYVLVHLPMRPDGKPMCREELREWHLAQTLLTEYHEAVLIPVHHAFAFDHGWLSETVCRFQSFLLQSYKWVLFAEVDEFIFPTPGAPPRPARRTLFDHVRQLDSNSLPAIRATGFEIVQQNGEPAVSSKKYNTGANVGLTAGELIRDRHWWRPSELYSKTLLGQVPLRWSIGFHRIEGLANEIATGTPSDALTLVHLHKVDFELALSRLRRSRARKWSSIDIERSWGLQNQLATADELRTFWELDIDSCQPAAADRLVPIAQGVKEALS
jgi:hypothetical protein